MLPPLVADWMVKTAQNLFNAAQDGDRDYALGQLEQLRSSANEIIKLLKEG